SRLPQQAFSVFGLRSPTDDGSGACLGRSFSSRPTDHDVRFPDKGTTADRNAFPIQDNETLLESSPFCPVISNTSSDRIARTAWKTRQVGAVQEHHADP